MVWYRGVPVGGGSPITIQSMTTVPAADVRRTMYSPKLSPSFAYSSPLRAKSLV